jgi:hypothetical protein
VLLSGGPACAQVLGRPPRGRADERSRVPTLAGVVARGDGGAPVSREAKVDEDGLVFVREEDIGRLVRAMAKEGEEKLQSAAVCWAKVTKERVP